MNSDEWIDAMNKEVNRVIEVRDQIRAMASLEAVVDDSNRTSVLARMSQQYSTAVAALSALTGSIQSLEKGSRVSGGGEAAADEAGTE